MKLPNPFTRDTASSLQRAISERDSAEQRLAELHTKRAAAIIDADDISEIEAIDRQVEAAHHTAEILADRILALDARLHAEAEEARKKEYAASVAVVERLLPLRNDAAGEVEKAMLAVAAACRKYDQVTASIADQWPANLVKPGYRLSMRPLGERLKSSFAMSSIVYATNHAPVQAADFIRRACSADERAAGFAAAEAKDHAELIEELRNTRNVTRIEPEPEEEAA